MGILNNGFRDRYCGLRFAGAGLSSGITPSAQVQNFHMSGRDRNKYCGEGISSKLASVPAGNTHPVAWVLPQLAGAMSAYSTARLEITTTSTIYGGKALEGSVLFTIDTNTPDGELIAFGIGSSAISITTNTPLLTASLNAIGAASFTINTNTPTLGAEASLIASATITFTAGMTPYAIGIMEGTTEEAGLTNAGIANSVWNSYLANYNESGTAGKALATASSGGVDLVAMAQAILDAAQLTPIHANVKQMNSANVLGTGIESDKWRGNV